MGTVVGIVLLANFLVFDVDHLRNWWSSRWFDISKSSIAVDQPPGNTGGPSFHWLGWSSISAQTFWIGKNGRVAGSLRKCPTPPQPSPLLPLFALQLSRIGNVICLVHKTFLCQKKPTITKQSQTHFFSQIKVEWLPPLPSPLSPVKTISSLEPDQTTFSCLFPDSSKWLENYQHHLHMKTWTSCACSLDCCTVLTSEWMESNTSLNTLVPPISKQVSRLKLNLSFLP